MLKIWSETFAEIDKQYDALKDLFGASPESPIARAMYDTFSRYTDAISVAVGDADDWLEWYAWENDMGQKEMEAKAAGWSKARPICSVDDLLDLIEGSAK